MEIKEKIIIKLEEIVKELTKEDIKIELSRPSDDSHGDYSSNIAMRLAKQLGKNPLEIAQQIAEEFSARHSGEARSADSRIENEKDSGQARMTDTLGIEKVEAVSPGFINFHLSKDAFIKSAEDVLKNPEKVISTNKMQGKKLMVEFAHPNTHKEMHLGHMRTLITGESVSRLLESQEATVFRANYQGDIGPHVAKALYGIEKIIQEKGLTLEEIEKWSNKDKSHFLGEGYVRGNKDYDSAKEEIDDINNTLYKKEPGHYWDLYLQTHKWSMDYYDEFYARFYTKYDRLFLESEMYTDGKKIVEEHVGTIFVKDTDGSIIFPGEKYGLHTRVFITQAGNPTYEGKEIKNALVEWDAFHFDKKIHVVASEQAGYFQVVFKALELLDPEKFVDKQYHLSMGMVQLVGRKMSSRTGDILTVDWLIDQVKEAASALFKEGKLEGKEKENVLEKVAIGAVKYSVLKGGTRQDTVFDIEKSVSLQGNSGPYVQYSYTRTHSILNKAQNNFQFPISNFQLNEEELKILRLIQKFPEIVEEAALTYSPNVVAEYLFTLSQLFNNFYQKYRILNAEKEEEKEFRLALTATVGIILKQGLNLLGIAAPEKM